MTAVAWVAGTPLHVSDVDEREVALRGSRVAGVLPREHTGEGRQLRRWLVQVLAAERLVEVEAAARGLTEADALPLSAIAGERVDLLGLGSVAAELVSRVPLARAVFGAVTAGVAVAGVERFYQDNPERFRVLAERVVRHRLGEGPEVRRVLRRGELIGAVEDAVFAAEVGEVVGPVRDPLGVHVVVVEEVRPERVRPLAEVRESIAGWLTAAARRRAFTTWLDHGLVTRVRLAPGYEHPGDPDQPDNTHRH